MSYLTGKTLHERFYKNSFYCFISNDEESDYDEDDFFFVIRDHQLHKQFIHFTSHDLYTVRIPDGERVKTTNGGFITKKIIYGKKMDLNQVIKNYRNKTHCKLNLIPSQFLTEEEKEEVVNNCHNYEKMDYEKQLFIDNFSKSIEVLIRNQKNDFIHDLRNDVLNEERLIVMIDCCFKYKVKIRNDYFFDLIRSKRFLTERLFKKMIETNVVYDCYEYFEYFPAEFIKFVDKKDLLKYLRRSGNSPELLNLIDKELFYKFIKENEKHCRNYEYIYDLLSNKSFAETFTEKELLDLLNDNFHLPLSAFEKVDSSILLKYIKNMLRFCEQNISSFINLLNKYKHLFNDEIVKIIFEKVYNEYNYKHFNKIFYPLSENYYDDYFKLCFKKKVKVDLKMFKELNQELMFKIINFKLSCNVPDELMNDELFELIHKNVIDSIKTSEFGTTCSSYFSRLEKKHVTEIYETSVKHLSKYHSNYESKTSFYEQINLNLLEKKQLSELIIFNCFRTIPDEFINEKNVKHLCLSCKVPEKFLTEEFFKKQNYYNREIKKMLSFDYSKEITDKLIKIAIDRREIDSIPVKYLTNKIVTNYVKNHDKNIKINVIKIPSKFKTDKILELIDNHNL